MTLPTIDTGDLVAALVSLRGPSRAVDEMINAMLGGRSARHDAERGAFVMGAWLADETLAFTAGGSAVDVLALRLGATIEATARGGGFRAVAKDPHTGIECAASAPTEGGAACAALAVLSMRRSTLPAEAA